MAKFLKRFDWHDPDKSNVDRSWMSEIPEKSQFLGKNRRFSRPNMAPSSVMFVPNSHKGILIKRLEQLEPKLVRMCGYRVRLVEAAGTPLSRLFSFDMSSGKCHRVDCYVCLTHTVNGSSRCKRKSVLYSSICQVCKEQGSDHGCYIGETGRSLHERAIEHVGDALDCKEGSHIFKHWAVAHQYLLTCPRFSFKVIKTHKSAMDRQIHEAIKIADCGSLNAKCEYRQNQVKRLSVQLTAEEATASRLDVEIGTVKALVSKLNVNKGSFIDPYFSLSAQPTTLNSQISGECDLFTDQAQKRVADWEQAQSAKRLKLCRLSPRKTSSGSASATPEMVRKSKGNMNNDSKHIKGDVLEEFSDRERLRNTPVLNLKSDVLEEFSDLEQLRNTPGLNLKTPTTFAEAASMAKERMKMRELSLVSGILRQERSFMTMGSRL